MSSDEILFEPIVDSPEFKKYTLGEFLDKAEKEGKKYITWNGNLVDVKTMEVISIIK